MDNGRYKIYIEQTLQIKIIEKTHTQMVIHILIYIPHNYSAYQNDILQAFQILSISM